MNDANYPEASTARIDIATIAGIACIAYVIGVALHEHAGHALACILLGGKVKELGAFYVDCDYQNLSDLSIRLVALAGPMVSLWTGIVAFYLLRHIHRASAPTRLLFWLLGSIGWMTATGYLLFSGISGLGDFGTTRDGVLFNLHPEWLWRTGAIVLGVTGYWMAIQKSVHSMENMIGGGGTEKIRRAQKIALTSYLTGGLVSLAIGLLNPYGWVIVLISAMASSFGGTSGLAWEMSLMNENRDTGKAPLQVERSLKWIIAGVVITVLYTIVFGPSIKL